MSDLAKFLMEPVKIIFGKVKNFEVKKTEGGGSTAPLPTAIDHAQNECPGHWVILD